MVLKPLISWEAFDLLWWDHTSHHNMVGALLGREVLGAAPSLFQQHFLLLTEPHLGDLEHLWQLRAAKALTHVWPVVCPFFLGGGLWVLMTKLS